MYRVYHPHLTKPVSQHHKLERAIKAAEKIPGAVVVNPGYYHASTQIWPEHVYPWEPKRETDA